MKLNLKRPIIFFDLETTGIDTARDRIVEISMIKIMPDGEEITRTRRLNPCMPIPPEATAVHGITDDDVKDCPTFAQVAKSLEQFIRGCDFGGFNSNRFDLPVLVEEFLRAGVDVDLKKRKFIDVQNIFHKKEQRTLVAAYKFYCDKDLDDAHSVDADSRATYEVLKAQLEAQNGKTNPKKDQASDKTRKQSDKNMNNFRKIVVADNDDDDQKYKTEYRGRVQDKNVTILPQPMFVLSYYEREEEVKRQINFAKCIDEVNSRHV